MATSIGSLFLELRLDTQSYQQALQNARSMALNVGKDIDRGLSLKPTVDHTELTKLNQHLDLKQKHFKEVQAYFDRNPLTPRVKLDELNFARSEVKAFRREIQDLKSETAVKIQLQAEHRINTSNFESAVDRATKRFEKAGDDIGKKIADRVSKASVKVSGGGILGGLTQGILFGLGQKITDGTSQKLNQALGNFGRTAENYVTRRAGRAAVGISQDLGYRNTREMRRDIGRVGSFVDGFIDPKRVRAEGKKFEENLSKAAIAFFSEGQSFKSVARQFAKDMSPPGAGKGAAEAGLRVAGFGLRQVSPVLRINKDVQLAKAAKQAEQIAEQIEINQETIRELEKANAIVFAIGGLHQAGGKGGAELVKPRLQRMMPGAYVQGVSNKYRDSNAAPAGIDAFLGKIKPGLTSASLLKKAGLENSIPIDYLKFLDTAVFSGATPETIEAAARIKALQRVSNKPAYAVGYSSGGADASDLVRLTEMMGTPIKGVGLGSPMMGIASRKSKNFTPVLGTADPFYRSLFTKFDGTFDPKADPFTNMQQSGMLANLIGSPMAGSFNPKFVGQGHNLSNYLASPAVQGLVRGMMPGTVPTAEQMPKSLAGRNAIAGYEFIQYQADQGFDKTLNKINEARSTPSPVVRDKIISELKQKQQDYKKRYASTTGSIKEELEALLETLNLGISALEEMQKGSGLPTKQYRDLIDQMNKQVGKYYELSDNNAKLQRERFFAGEQLEPPPPPPKMTLAQKGQSVFRKVAGATGALANQGAIAAINNKLARSGAFQDELGFTPQIASLGDLSPRGYLEIAKQDMGTTMKFLQGTVGKGYGMLKGVENAAFSAVPPLRPIKGAVQQVAYPMIAFNAMTHGLPMGEAIGAGVHNAVGSLVHLPAGGMEAAVSGTIDAAIAGAAQNVQGIHLPDMMHKIPKMAELEGVVNQAITANVQNALTATSQAIESAATGAIETVAGGITNVLTPLIGGKAAMAPLESLGGAIVGDQSQLIEASTQKAKMIGMGIDRAGKMLTARPETTQKILGQVGGDLKQLNAQLDQGLAKLAPLERTGTKEGNQLAQLKSQVAQQEKKINLLLKGLQQMIQNPGQMMEQSIHPDVIDAEYEVVSPNQLKPATAKMLPSQDLVQQAEKNAIARIKQLGEVFKQQREFTQSGQYGSTQVAMEIQSAVAEARSEIDAITKAMGKQASKGLKDAAKTARRQITDAEKASGKAIDSAKESGKLGQDMVSGVNTGLQQGIAGAKSAAQQLAEAIKSTIQDEFEIKSPSRWMIRMMKFVVQGAEIGLDGLSKAGVGKKLEPIKKEVETTVKGVLPQLGDLAEVGAKAFSMLPAPIKAVVGAFAAFGGLSFVTDFMGRISQEATRVALEFQSLERRLGGGNLEKGAQILSRVSQEANQLGLNAKVAAEGYTQLASATRGGSLEGSATDQIFSAVQSASSAYQLTPQRQELVNNAIAQMASKGTVSMEELRQQLGESLPGAMQIAARSMNMTTAQFNKFVASGQLASDEFLPRFGQQLKAEVAVAAESASNSAQGSFNRLQNKLTELQVSFGKGSLPIQAFGADAITAVLGEITKNASTVLSVLTAISLLITGSILKALYQVATSLGLIPSLASLGTNAFRAMGAAIAGATAKLAMLTALFQLGGKFANDFRDKSVGSLKEIGDTSKKTAEQLNRTLNEGDNKKKQKSIEEELGIKKGFLGTYSYSRPEEWYMNIPGLSQVATTFFGQKSATERLVEFKQERADTRRSIGNTESGTTSAIQASIAQRNNPEVARLRELNKQIEQNKLQQRMTQINSPDSPGAIAQLRQQESALLKQREEISKRTGAIQASLSQNIQGLKQAIAELENKPEYVNEVARLRTLLKDAEQAQTEFNRSLDSGATRLERFNKTWEDVIANLADAKTKIETTSALNVASILNAESTGSITQGQSQSMQQLENQRKLGEIIAKNQSAIARLNSELSDPDIAQRLSTMGVTKQTGREDLRLLSERIGNPKDKDLLDKVSQLRQLEEEAAKSQADLASAQAEATRQIREASKAVTDFARGIARQVEDINASVKQQELEIKSSNLKARIDEALTGVQQTVVSGLTDAIISFLNAGKEKTQNLINAINNGRNAIRQVEDAQLNASELMRNQPGYGNVGNMVGGMSASQAPVGSRIAGKLKVTNRNDPDGSGYGFDYGVWEGGDDRGVGAPVVALAGGRVVEIRRNSAKYGMGGKRGFGNQVYVRVFNPETGKESDVAYGHLNDINVTEGEVIGRGHRIGTQGETGSATAPHVTLNVFAKGTGGGGAAEVALGRILERSVDRGVYANVGNVSSPTGIPQRPMSSMKGVADAFGFDRGRANQALQYFMSQGLTPKGAAYVVGNFMQESSLNPAADNGTHRGLGQWSRDRIRSAGGTLPSSFEGQLAFALKDMGIDSPDSLATLKNPNATDAQMRKSITNWMRYGSGEEKSRFTYATGLARQLGGAGGVMKPTTGMSVGDINAAQQASQLNIESAQQVNASLGELKNATAGLQKAEMDAAIARNNAIDKDRNRQIVATMKTIKKATEDEANTARGRVESLRDRLRGVGYDTPEREYENRVTDIRRQTRDLGVELNRAVELNLDALKELNEQEKLTADAMKRGEMPEDIGKQTLETIKNSRANLTQSLQYNRQAQAELKAVEEKQIKDAEQKRDLAIAKRRQEFAGRFAAQQAEQMKLEAEMLKTMGTDPRRAISLQDEAQRIEIKNSTAEQVLGFQEAARQSGMAEEEIQKLIAGFKKLEELKLENVTLQTRKLRQELEIMQKKQIFDSITKVADAEIEGFRIIGLDRFAKDIEREKALAQERMNFEQEMKRINDMGLDDATKSQVTANEERAFKKRVDNVKRQYSVLNEIIANNKGAFQDFFTGLLNGTESFGSAFSKMVSSIANNLASMASDFLTNELMGIFTGKNRMANQKDAKDLMGNVSPAVTYDGQGRELSIALENGGTQFVGLTQQAGQQIIAAAEAFNQIVSTGGFSSIDGGNLPIRMMDFTGDTAMLPEFTSAIDTSSSKLFESAQNASFSILDGVQIASDYLADAGTGTSDNLLGGLQKGLPGILQSVFGAIGGGSGGGFGGIIGSLVSPLLGGLFGGGGGDIMGGLAIDLGSPVVPMLKNGGFVPNFAKGGFSSDDRAFMNGSLFKGANPIAQAVRREGSGAIVGVMNKDEYVLTPSETQIFFALGFDKIVKGRTPNFRMGGAVGANTGNAARFTRGQEVSITVPVTVSDGSSVDPQKLAESIRGAVQNEIAKQQRPGGQLY